MSPSKHTNNVNGQPPKSGAFRALVSSLRSRPQNGPSSALPTPDSECSTIFDFTPYDELSPPPYSESASSSSSSEEVTNYIEEDDDYRLDEDNSGWSRNTARSKSRTRTPHLTQLDGQASSQDPPPPSKNCGPHSWGYRARRAPSEQSRRRDRFTVDRSTPRPVKDVAQMLDSEDRAWIGFKSPKYQNSSEVVMKASRGGKSWSQSHVWSLNVIGSTGTPIYDRLFNDEQEWVGVDPSVEYGVTPQDLQGKGTFFTNRGVMIYLYTSGGSRWQMWEWRIEKGRYCKARRSYRKS
ncbi:uncharacterized protein STEHIDRAFT_113657 [Stereum hirsutum FP-91666 SS1]|uniref:uncharacterized protein n=1 Tax=Stereum hirsutum (strain FP-91666) TaxID=721885 RepID=UPI00044494A7|nr:uncharacterized protein STEHIDRAFT_113657 [Stereum hirsutum FP-91666 SS1]EIM83557.1 hypothetical protein STEHIDRAFT_113657 [Stereum hirsutum FP-91666 SS1]